MKNTHNHKNNNDDDADPLANMNEGSKVVAECDDLFGELFSIDPYYDDDEGYGEEKLFLVCVVAMVIIVIIAGFI